MSITSRRSVRENEAATSAASSGDTANTDEYTFTPAGTPSIGTSVPSSAPATSAAVPSPPTNNTRSTGSAGVPSLGPSPSSPANARTTAAVCAAVVSVGSGAPLDADASSANGSTTRTGS